MPSDTLTKTKSLLVYLLLSSSSALLSVQASGSIDDAGRQQHQHRLAAEFITGTTSAGEECTCEIPEGSNSNIVISRPDCDPNDVETCQANCVNLHGDDDYLADKCCIYPGMSASLLAFEEDSQWVPRIEEFNKCTGASVRLEYLPEGEDGMADALRMDLGDDISHEQGLAAGQGIFDAYIVQAPWLWPVVNGLENLSPLIRENADTVQFLDINAASRAAVSYNGTVRALPLDTDYIALGWRQDVFHKYDIPPEMSPPRTIEDLALVAKLLNGKDFNDDGEVDWGICLTPQVNYFYAFVAPMMQSALKDPQTGIETGQNMFFTADTFAPLIYQPAFKAALEAYWTIIMNSNCQEQLAKGEKCDRKTAFPTGRCAMVISMPGTLTKMLLDGAKYAPVQRLDEATGEVEWDINDQPLGEGGSYWGRRSPFPGSTIVQKWDPEAGFPLVECSEPGANNCPKADANGINYAPYFAEGGEAYSINGRQSKPAARRVMWDMFTWLSELPVTELPLSGQYRTSHLGEEQREDLTERAGWPNQMVDDIFNVLGAYFKSEEDGGNPVQDLLMLGFPEYMGALDEELHDKFLGVSKDATGGLFDRADPSNSIHPETDRETFDAAFNEFVKALGNRYNYISDNISGGQIGQLQRWRQSLNLPWKTEEELCVDSLSSTDVEAFQRLQCPSIVNLESLCRLQPEDLEKYDEDYCSSFQSENHNLAILIPAIVVPILLVVAIGAYLYVERKKRLENTIWTIKPDELKFDEPPEIVGRGTFGLVLLAQYRGTQVAVKRVVPPKRDGSSVGGKINGTDSVASDEDFASRSVASSDGFGACLQKTNKSSKGKNRTDGDETNHSSKTSEEDGIGHPTNVVVTMTNEEKGLNDEEESGGDIEMPLKDEEFGGDIDMPLNDGESGEIVEIQVALNDGEKGLSSASRRQKNSDNQSTGTLSVDLSKSSSQFSMLMSGGLKSLIFGDRDDRKERKADFIREMKHLSKLRHPCITTVMGAVIDKSVEPMLVMEFCEHGSLHDLLRNESMPLDGDVLLPILGDICQGIRFLHAADPQIVHGDLKAANILVDSRFRAKVADFGLSAKKATGATGTPLWMAPELLRGESGTTPASDVFSFGIILVEVYSRKDPYEGEDPGEIIFQIAHPTINRRPNVPKACPSTIATIYKECVDASPEARPTFEELDMRLKRLSPDSVSPQDSPLAAYGRRKREAGADNLLRNVFPPHIAEALREGKKVEKEHHECVTIFFSDIVGFTTISAKIGPQKVADLLDRLYTVFDDLTIKHEIFKIETIGDAYMAITNLVKDQNSDHVKRVATFSMDAIEACKTIPIDESDPSQGTVQIRVGFHSGPVLSGVVGTRLPKYGVFGDTVNTASRMESNSSAMKIHCSKASAVLLKKQAPGIPLKSRGRIQIKGKEKMATYWVNGSGDVESGDGEGPKTPAERIQVEQIKVPPQESADALLEVVTLSELAKRAKKAGMTLADFPDTYGARTLAELLSRGPSSGDDISDDDSTDYFLQSHQNEADIAEIEKLRHDVAARLGVRIGSAESKFNGEYSA